MMDTEKIVFKFPFDAVTLKEPSFKTATKEPTVVREVSFPNVRVPQMRVITDDYILKIAKVPSNLIDIYKTFGKGMAEYFKDMENREIREMPELKIVLSKSTIADFHFEKDPMMTSYKKMSDGWFKEWNEVAFIDFFGM